MNTRSPSSTAFERRASDYTDTQSVDGTSSSPEAERNTSRGAKRKRAQVATACGNCRKAKLRCNGRHPACERCQSRGLCCTYDVAVEGLTRREYLRVQFEEQREKLEQCNVVMTRLVSGTDEEAAEMLARLRMGDSVEQLYQRLVAEPSQERTTDMKNVKPWNDRPVLHPLDVRNNNADDPEAGLRALALSSARGSPYESPYVSEFALSESQHMIDNDALVFPANSRPSSQSEGIDPSL